MTYCGGYPVKRRRVPDRPRLVLVRVSGRTVAELLVTSSGDIVPGSLVWTARPEGVSGPDREAAAAYVVRVAKLDPKVDHDRVFDALWSQAQKRV